MNAHAIEEHALKVTSGDSSGGRGRGSFRGRGRGGGRRSFDKSTIECYSCIKLGHFAYECPNKVIEGKANYAEGGEEMLLMAYVNEKATSKEELWFLDSGCSNHMCGKKELFFYFDGSFRETLKLGDNSSMDMMGKGNIRMFVNGFVQIITGVFYIPSLKNSLLSIGQLAEKGLAILIQRGTCKLYHPEKGLIMEIAMASNRMFKLFAQIQSKEQVCFNSSSEDNAMLWHNRYGHLSFTGLNLLQQKGMVRGLPNFDAPSKACGDCLIGKQQRNSFPKATTWRASKVLQLVHADICGPITPISNSNKSYSSDPDKINDIDHIRAMEESLKESLSRIQSHKDDFGKQQLMPLECTSQFQNGIHLPLGMGGEQEAQPISWLHNSDRQHMMLSEDPNLLPQRVFELTHSLLTQTS
eukprot:TRINITY_DN3586_c0_g1_i10.p1 TRINITY_DN3586_c0_g1~~TRINITY_DN3586_c0_g1_i10.p1  ORF type:complete len:412 (-),score=71.57 TRINITY_DN3586_c0_g1_i10:714-1949(-)